MARGLALLVAAVLLLGAVWSAIPRSECSTYQGLVEVRRSDEPSFRLRPPGVPRTPGQTPEMTMGTRRDCFPVEANRTLALILAAFGLASIWYAAKV